MSAPRRRTTGIGTAGFTLVEIMVALVMATIVMAVLFRSMVATNRSYTDQREVIDARETARSAAVLLVSEVRTLSAAGGDLYSIGAQSLTVRSTRGLSSVCTKHVTASKYAVWRSQGERATGDSILIHAARGVGPDDDEWHTFRITAIQTPAAGGVTKCGWGDTLVVRPEAVWTVTGDTTGIKGGAPVRVFQRVEYGIYSDAGRWWLGRKVAGAASFEKLTGPLRAPTAGGLALRYFDVNGNETANRLAVATIEIVVRTESTRASRRNGVLGPRIDSVRTRVTLRG